MQQDIGQMMPARVCSIELPVHHVGESGQGQPILGAGQVCEYPGNPMETEPLGDGRIRVNINIIVVADEFVVQGLTENSPYCYCEENADCKGLTAAAKLDWLRRGVNLQSFLKTWSRCRFYSGFSLWFVAHDAIAGGGVPGRFSDSSCSSIHESHNGS